MWMYAITCFYNWAGAGCYGGEGMHVNIVNNYYKPGPATPSNSRVRYRIAAIGVRTSKYVTGKNGQANAWKPMEHIWGRFYVTGNVMEGDKETTINNWPKGIYDQIEDKNDNTFNEQVKKEIRLISPLETDVVTTHSAREAYRLVVQYAGCSKQRDVIDLRIAEETQNGTATYFGSISSDAENYPGLIDVPDDAKPANSASAWPDLSNKGINPEFLKDSDGDGMPDWWENKNNFNPDDISDSNTITLSKDGYTNLEVYLNGLVDEITQKQDFL